MLPELLRPKEVSKSYHLKEAVNVLDKFVLKGKHIKPHPVAKALYLWYEDYYRREIPVKIENKNYMLKVSTHPYPWERGHALEITLSSRRGREVNSTYLPSPDRLDLYFDVSRMGLNKIVELLEVDVLPLLRNQILKDEAWTPDVV